MDLFTRRFRERSTEFIDEKNKTQKLDTQELTRLLEQCKAWGEQRLCAKYSKWDPRAMDEAFFKEYFTDVCMVINKNNPFEDERYLYDMPSDSDSVNGYEIAMIPLLCINSNSRSKGTAWKFIKFLLSEKVQLALNYMPLNRKAAEMRIDEQISDLVILDLEKAKTNKQNILNLIEKVSSRASFFTLPSSCEKIVEAEARRYYLGEVSAEKAAKSMATKVELYLKEQN